MIIDQQFGFRIGHSTVQQTLRIAQSIVHEINVNRAVGLIVLDLSKAFDSVWHAALIYKLYSISLPTGFNKLITSYLKDRLMFVRCNLVKSAVLAVPAGVPQGSILGPTLFNIFINDIPNAKFCDLALYADDTAFNTSFWQIPTLVLCLQSYLDEVLHYFALWKLQINSGKTEAIIFNRNPNNLAIRHNHRIYINNVAVP